LSEIERVTFGRFKLGAVLVLMFESVIRSYVRTESGSTVLPDIRKGTALFDGSHASPACPSDKILLSCR
jgi:hypothetical protein